MKAVTVRELRNHGGDVLDRVQHGESIRVTRDGKDVAELRPLPRRSPTPADLISSRRYLPRVDPAGLKADIDRTLDSGL